MMRFDVITLFPEIIDEYFSSSIFKRAQKKKIIKVKAWQLRDFTKNKHKQVDDKPFGGGPGMVLKIEPIYKAVQHITQRTRNNKRRIILFSTRGKPFTQKEAQRLSHYQHLIFICGRYEGVDERVARHIADEELSTGNFVLSGGEIPAMIVIDAVSRHIRGVLGQNESLEELKGSYVVYTRPEKFLKWRAPKILLTGHHKKIERFRKKG